MWRYCEGFRAGAVFVDENINVQVAYREGGDREKLFIDEAWGFDTAHQLVSRGADVIFAAGGATGQGALRAAAEEQVRAIGTERDQRAVLAESGSSVATSILGSASFEVQTVLSLIKERTAYEPEKSQIRYVPFDQKINENLTREMDLLLLALDTAEVMTNVTLSKP
jgi:basic membrane protein A